jgi:hypothetical protein
MDRRECGNIFPDLKLTGELCVLETCTQGSEEGSCKSALVVTRWLPILLPALRNFEIIARHKRFGGGFGCVLPFRARAGRTTQALGLL